MRIIQTLTTTPDKFGEPFVKKQLKLFECSIRLAKRFYPITLYTDERGANHLGHLVDEVKFLEKNTENYLWCEPKFEAMKKETGDFIHMDGDVFLAEPLNIPKAYDVLCDSYEFENTHYSDNLQVFDEWGIKNIFSHWSADWQGANNVGIISFKNPAHMKLYINTFYDIKEFYFKKSKETKKQLVIPELIMEQLSLKLLTKGEGWNTIPLDRSNSYIHLNSVIKFKSGFMQFIEVMNKKFYTDNNNYTPVEEEASGVEEACT